MINSNAIYQDAGFILGLPGLEFILGLGLVFVSVCVGSQYCDWHDQWNLFDCTLVCASRDWGGGKHAFILSLPLSYTDTCVLTSLSHSLVSLWQTLWPWLHHPLHLSVCLCHGNAECNRDIMFLILFPCLWLSICNNIIKWGVVLWILAQVCSDILLVSDSSVMSHGGVPWPSGKQEEWSKRKGSFLTKTNPSSFSSRLSVSLPPVLLIQQLDCLFS